MNDIPKNITIRGRNFSQQDIKIIKKITARYFSKGRTFISKKICEKLDWKQPNGWFKDRACRDVLLTLEEMEILILPKPMIKKNKKKKNTDDINSIRKSFLSKYGENTITYYQKPRLEMIRQTKKEKLWNSLVRVFHYESYGVIVGRNLKYIAYYGNIPIACIGWGDPAWALESRDKLIGWDTNTKQKKLHKIVNNVRFLILPWVKVPNIASTLLAMNEKLLVNDWLNFYDIEISLLETFVEKSRFNGTCYKATNWRLIGETKGTAKRGNSHYKHNNIKYVFIKPLNNDFPKGLIE